MIVRTKIIGHYSFVTHYSLLEIHTPFILLEKAVVHIINKAIHVCLEIPDLFLVLNMISHLFAALTRKISPYEFLYHSTVFGFFGHVMKYNPIQFNKVI